MTDDEEAFEALEKIKDIVSPLAGAERRRLEEQCGAAEANARRMSQYAETVKHESDAIEKKLQLRTLEALAYEAVRSFEQTPPQQVGEEWIPFVKSFDALRSALVGTEKRKEPWQSPRDMRQEEWIAARVREGLPPWLLREELEVEVARLKEMLQAQAEQLSVRPLRLCEACPKEGDVAVAADHYLCNHHAEALSGAVLEAWKALKAAGADDECEKRRSLRAAIETLVGERDAARRDVDVLEAALRQGGGPLSDERRAELQSDLQYGDWRAEKATKALKEDLAKCRQQLCSVEDELRAARQPSSPVPLILNCPVCHARHIDRGEFATRSHHTHSCQNCGLTWRPAVVATVGVEFLPGFRDPT